jgi:hypothetical protein
MSNNKGRGLKPKIDRAVQDKIGRELRAMYEELLRQPLPENLTAPLRAYDEVQTARQRLNEAIEAMRPASPPLKVNVTSLLPAKTVPQRAVMRKASKA